MTKPAKCLCSTFICSKQTRPYRRGGISYQNDSLPEYHIDNLCYCHCPNPHLANKLGAKLSCASDVASLPSPMNEVKARNMSGQGWGLV